GTFDVSIVELNHGVMEVRASHGDTNLGGDDFDEALLDQLADGFQEEHGVDPRLDPRAYARLLRAAERAKITLSSHPFVRVREEYLLEKDGTPLHLDVEIERAEFEELIFDLVERTLSAFDQALVDAGVTVEELDHVLLVGGSTRVPVVRNMVTAHARREPLSEIKPDEAVSLGAAVQAAIIAGEPIETILVDVTPHSLGIEVAEIQYGELVPDRFNRIIERNTTLPTRKAQVYSALYPDQTEVRFKVFQGESAIASQNTLLGEFLFEGLKPERRGEPPRVTVEFDLDLNGILNVSATDRGSAKVRQTTLHAAHTRLSPAEAEASAQHLAGLEREVLGEEGEDDPLLSRARSLLAREEAEMEDLRSVVGQLEAARRLGSTDDIEALSERLVDLMYDLEEE
ncbi:MAG: Hsp70 family protein, partial [Actinomycetota bacterium]